MYDEERKVKKEIMGKLDKCVCFCFSLAVLVSRTSIGSVSVNKVIESSFVHMPCFVAAL